MVVLLRVRNPRAPMRSNGPVILSRTVFVGRALCSVLGVEVSVSQSVMKHIGITLWAKCYK